MAVANGYGKVATSGSVFMYDVGDTYNSYKGQPGTNITTGVNKVYNGYNKITYDNGMFFETNGYTEVVNIPALGPTTVQSVEINNAYCGYGCNGNYQCCPTLFTYTGGWMSSIWSPGQTYSYQIIYKCTSGYTHPNFMYHYEYNSSEGYLTEYGVFTTDKQESLGDGWYHAWNTFTTNASAAKGYTGLWYYNYNVADKVSIAAVSISPGDTIRPPREIIPSGTTRSATQGLLPIVGNSTIDLSNVSFDSSAQMVFDGTNDYMATSTAIPCNFGTGDFTIEVLIYPQSFASYTHMVALPSQSTFALKAKISDGVIYYYDPAFTTYGSTSGWTLTLNQWNHVVLVRSGNIAYAYLNGVPKGSKTGFNTNFSSTQIVNVGNGGVAEYTQKKVDVVKIYNRALSAAEVRQNYLHYKTRFNLS